MKLRPSTLSRLLLLREKLYPIANLSYLFSKINKDYPIDTLDEETAEEVIDEYKKILKQASDFYVDVDSL